MRITPPDQSVAAFLPETKQLITGPADPQTANLEITEKQMISLLIFLLEIKYFYKELSTDGRISSNMKMPVKVTVSFLTANF